MSAPVVERKTVLVVDDDVEGRLAMAEFLESEGCRVVSVADGYEALEQMRWHLRPACVVLDLRMPVMTGWELRKAMEDTPALRDIPVIAVTGGPRRQEDDGKFIALIGRPVNIDQMRSALRQCGIEADGE